MAYGGPIDIEFEKKTKTQKGSKNSARPKLTCIPWKSTCAIP